MGVSAIITDGPFTCTVSTSIKFYDCANDDGPVDVRQYKLDVHGERELRRTKESLFKSTLNSLCV